MRKLIISTGLLLVASSTLFGQVRSTSEIKRARPELMELTRTRGAVGVPLSITSWSTLRVHGAAGQLEIPLDPSLGQGAADSEPRRGGIREIRVVFSEPAQPVDGTFDLNDVVITGSDLNTYANNGGGLSGDTLTLTFADGDLPNGLTFNFDVGGLWESVATSSPLAGDADCNVLSLAGDSNNDGNVNLIDAAQVKSKNGETADATNTRQDLTTDGKINLIDVAFAVAQASLPSPPDAVDDPGFSTPFETLLDSGLTSVLDNDSLAGGSISAFDAASAGGGTVIMNTGDGTFTYDPASGFSGPDTFTYELTNADGSDTATVTVTVGGGVAPVAAPDAYDVTGNVSIAVPAPGVLQNDSGAPFSITAFDNPSVNGGDVTVNTTTGAFAYDPPPGFEGLDSFTYDLTNGVGTVTGTVTLTVGGMIWFVDSSQGTNGDGRLSSPFNCLVGTGCFEPAATDAAGDNIFVRSGSYTGGLTLLDGQKLVGDGSSSDLATVTGITLAPNSVALPIFSGTDPLVAGPADIIGVGSGNTIRGLTLSSGSGTGIRGNNFGTLSVSETTVNGGGAIDVSDGVLDVTFDSLSASSSTEKGIRLASVSGTFAVTDVSGTIAVIGFPAVDITGTAGGVQVAASFASVSSTVSASGGIRLANLTPGSNFDGGNATVASSSGDGIALSNNPGSTFTFADLDIDNFSTDQRGLFASTSGTLNISDGDIDGGTASGVDINNTDLAITFTSVTSMGGSDAGINLSTTTGSFSVVGEGVNTLLGGNSTGGTISGKSGADGTNNGVGIVLNNASNVSLARMQLNDFTNFAIRGSNVNGFLLDYSTVSGTNGSSPTADEGSISLTNLSGSTINGANPTGMLGTQISGGLEDNVHIVNDSGILTRFVVDRCLIGANGAALGDDGILLEANGSATASLTVLDTNFTSARGDLLQGSVSNTAVMDVVLDGNAFSNIHANVLGGGVTINGTGDSTMTYDIKNNTFRDAKGHALNVFMGTGGAGDWSGSITNNTVGVSGLAASGSSQATGINVEAQGTGTHRTTVDGNTVHQFTENGMKFLAVDGSANLIATITNNTVDEPASFALQALFVQSGAASADSNSVCATITGNSLAGDAFSTDFRLRQRQPGTSFTLPGYGGTSADTAAVVSFVSGNNIGSPTGSATVNGAGFDGNVCP